MKNASLPIVLVLASSALLLAACGGGGTTSATQSVAPTVTDTAIGGGAAACDQATFDAWVKNYGEQPNVDGATLPPGQFQCADGWAVLMPTVGTADPNYSYTMNLIVQAEGPDWALMDRTKACGDSQANSQVPAGIYHLACETN